MSVNALFANRPTVVNPAVAEMFREQYVRAQRGANLDKQGYEVWGATWSETTYCVQKPNGVIYQVVLDDANDIVTCDCEDWNRNRLPCKHAHFALKNRAAADAERQNLIALSDAAAFVPVPDEFVDAQCDEYDARHAWAAGF